MSVFLTSELSGCRQVLRDETCSPSVVVDVTAKLIYFILVIFKMSITRTVHELDKCKHIKKACKHQWNMARREATLISVIKVSI